jgi:hypothetical protein
LGSNTSKASPNSGHVTSPSTSADVGQNHSTSSYSANSRLCVPATAELPKDTSAAQGYLAAQGHLATHGHLAAHGQLTAHGHFNCPRTPHCPRILQLPLDTFRCPGTFQLPKGSNSTVFPTAFQPVWTCIYRALRSIVIVLMTIDHPLIQLNSRSYLECKTSRGLATLVFSSGI